MLKKKKDFASCVSFMCFAYCSLTYTLYKRYTLHFPQEDSRYLW